MLFWDAHSCQKICTNLHKLSQSLCVVMRKLRLTLVSPLCAGEGFERWEEQGEFRKGIGQRSHVAHHGCGLPPRLRHLLLTRQLDRTDLWRWYRHKQTTYEKELFWLHHIYIFIQIHTGSLNCCEVVKPFQTLFSWSFYVLLHNGMKTNKIK